MKRFIKNTVGLIIFFFCLFFLIHNKMITNALIDLTPNSLSAILIEVETGQILYEKDIHTKRPPASMTKIMTLKLIYDALKSKRISLNDLITTSEHASSMGGSQIYLSVGEKMSVTDLLKSVAIASANDASVALSEAISGSEANFVTMMNEEAGRIGQKNTKYQNVTGLHDVNHYTSCYDVAIGARSLILEHGYEVLELTKLYESYVRENTDKKFWLVNTNKLVKFVPGVDGLKTGWTNEAGYCLTSTMAKDNMRVIAVVMGCANVNLRTKDTMALLNYTYANFEKEVLIPKGQTVKVVENVLLKPNQINIILSKDLVRINKKGVKPSEVQYKIDINYEKINKLVNHDIGKIKAYADNVLISEETLNLEVVSKKANFWNVLVEIIERIFS